MSTRQGQALVELAVCMPFVLLLGLGAAAVVEVADASAGLRAATEAAVTAAVRAPDAARAQADAHRRFDEVIAAYPVRSATLALDDAGFARGAVVTAAARGFVDLGWEAMAVVPARVDLAAAASARVDPWRTR